MMEKGKRKKLISITADELATAYELAYVWCGGSASGHVENIDMCHTVCGLQHCKKQDIKVVFKGNDKRLISMTANELVAAYEREHVWCCYAGGYLQSRDLCHETCDKEICRKQSITVVKQ